MRNAEVTTTDFFIWEMEEGAGGEPSEGIVKDW